jgi:hypothetical protein
MKTTNHTTERSITIREFKRAIRRLPRDEKVYNPNTWYLTQKEHWLGWLGQYHTAGAYGRQTGVDRDARFAYNHVVNPGLLLYLIKAIPLEENLIAAAEHACNNSGKTMMAQSGAIRKVAPWSVIYQALWG